MTNESGRLWDSEAAALLSLIPDHSRLLQTVVETARAIFAAQASSIFLLDPARENLVFEAVSGAGEAHLVGMRVPIDSGLVGWVMAAAEPIAVDDVDNDPLFARTVAESTGYVPKSIIAAPLLVDGEPIGVIEVLDRTSDSRGELNDLDILGLFAGQAAIGLQMLRRAWLADARTQVRSEANTAGPRSEADAGSGGSEELLVSALQLLRSCDEQKLKKALTVLHAVLDG
jgi:GAF domain-containing protein